jgi:hypothetical protein
MYSTSIAATIQVVTDKWRAGGILIARRIDGRDADQILGVLDDSRPRHDPLRQ